MPEAREARNRSARNGPRIMVSVLLAVFGMAALVGPIPSALASGSEAENGTEPASDTRAGSPETPIDHRELADRLVREHGIDTRHPDPSPWSYLGQVIERAAKALVEMITPHLERRGWLETTITWLARLLFIAALILVILAIRNYLRRRVPSETAEAALAVSEEPAMARRHNAEQDLLDCLQDGRAEAALEALWWWLADALGAANADPSWTTRELVVRHGRRDLMPPVRLFDRLVYGSSEPRVDQVRSLYHELRDHLNTEQAGAT